MLMVQRIDMPSETEESNGTQQPLSKRFSTSFSAAFNAANKRSQNIDETNGSPQPPTPARDHSFESWQTAEKAVSVGGETQQSEVEDESSQTTNGAVVDGRIDTSASMRSRRSSALDEGKRSGEIIKEPVPRLGAAEEGYFTAVSPNGKPIPPTKPAPSKITMPINTGDNSGSIPSRTHLANASISSTATLPPVEETSSALSGRKSSIDGMLKPPGNVHHHHRASSPPAFTPTASPTVSAKGPAAAPTRPDRLIHRHTLEVPKVRQGAGALRDSTEITSPLDMATTGRFSPNTPTKRHGSLNLTRRTTRSIHSDLHLDEFPQDEDAARWTEHIKARRASKKIRVDTDDDRVVVGTKVDEHHANWVTAYNMLTGIRFCVSRINAKLDRELTDADFQAKHKFSFDITGTELTPSAKYDFKFKDYAPWVFRHLRAKFRIDPADYLVSLTSKYILSELGSPGKSGSFFYFSRDYKYIIKTIHHGEHKFLRKILKEYYNHVTENPNTLLSQFYGLHRVKIPYGRKIHFVVMNNLFPPHRDIHRTFDLKGSTIGRDFKEEELSKNPRATLKDLNWLRRNLHLEFGPIKKEAFVMQMQKDVELMQKLNVMDYSLLVGIHDLERGNEENLRDKTLRVFHPGGDKGGEDPHATMLARTPSKMESAKRAQELRNLVNKERPVPITQMLDRIPIDPSRRGFYFYTDDGGFRATHEDNGPGEEVYYLGIIDCLTRWNYIKKVEHFWKGMRGNESQISPIPPVRYGDRFVKFISGITMSRERAEQDKGLETSAGITLPPNVEGTMDDPVLGGVNATRRDLRNPPGTAQVMERAERSAERSVEQGANEDIVPERVVTTAKSPGGPSESATLPVIGEAAEQASQASKTPTPSYEAAEGMSAPTVMTSEGQPSPAVFGKRLPPTPPKGEEGAEKANSTNEKWNGGAAPPTPPKDERKGGKAGKSLAPPTQPIATTTRLTMSPAPASERELERARSNA